ncbi:DnaJ C-terminal domain-containing protein [Gloeobacter violaceus]|uniref:Chaperone protein n=1 Tax=Gloeobacter violaceus (strain ATCC 29082 / PCC 7421) TaxID=251221 RepID=Q7NGQ4_GLOVI|nr:DnaJ C-terminal domain-containing protein [Gloeobacter violaceus]BAC91055.1 chaperone protein [Gloeobacter violaceus PCC 7421]
MEYRDYYEILGVPKSADEQQIKSTYRKLARQFHPDLNPGDKQAEEKFKTISEAYEVLSDPSKRSRYDQYGRYWQQAGRSGGTPAGGAAPAGAGVGGFEGFDFDFSRFGSFDEFIDSLMGNLRGSGGERAARANVRTTQRPGRSEDVEMSLELTLEEALNGTKKRVRTATGKVVEVNIPAGVHEGTKVRVAGEGSGRGDLFLVVKLKTHPFFAVDGDDLLCEVPLTPAEAALGTKVEVPTLTGRVRVTIPAGTSTGRTLRLAGRGLPRRGGGRGDQLVKIRIEVPTALSSEERDLYEKLSRTESFRPRARFDSQ